MVNGFSLRVKRPVWNLSGSGKEMIREREIRIGNVCFNAAVSPRHGPPLVFLHGVVRRWQDWSPLLPQFTDRWRVHAVDQRGHGKTDRAMSYIVRNYVEDGIAFLRTLDEPAVMVGHSLGALVAIGAAAIAPELVRAVVLEEPPSVVFLVNLAGSNYAIQWQAMQRLAASDRPIGDVASELAEVRLTNGTRMGDIRDALALRFLAGCLRHLDPAVLTPPLAGNWLEAFDLLHTASQVHVPALLMVADTAAGGMLPKTDADALADALPDCTRVNFPGMGHLIHGSDASRFSQTVQTFLDTL